MTEEDWFEDDPREWDLGGAELEYLEEGSSDPEIDESRWHDDDSSCWYSSEGIIDLEWHFETRSICLICGRSISLRRKVPPSENNDEDGHGGC